MGKKKVKAPPSVYDLDFHYDLEYDYRYDYNCQSHGCDESGICRCGEIVDFEIKQLNTDIYSLAKKIAKHFVSKPDDIFVYCVDRLLVLKKVYETSSFDVNIGGGYYGEEIRDIKIESSITRALDNDISQLMKLSDSDKIYFILEKEYGFVLDTIKECSFKFDHISQSDIVIPNADYSRKISKDEVEVYQSYPGPIGVFRRDSKKYLLVDGYHRYLANKDKVSLPAIVTY